MNTAYAAAPATPNPASIIRVYEAPSANVTGFSGILYVGASNGSSTVDMSFLFSWRKNKIKRVSVIVNLQRRERRLKTDKKKGTRNRAPTEKIQALIGKPGLILRNWESGGLSFVFKKSRNVMVKARNNLKASPSPQFL